MITIGLLAMAALSGAAPQQKPLPVPRYGIGGPDTQLIHRSADPEAKARKYLDDMARCLASHEHRQAAAALAMPYGSEQQGHAIATMMKLSDSCWGPSISGTSIGFEPQGAAAGMAEFFLTDPKAIDDVRRRDPQSFAWPAPTEMEAFGDCVVTQDEAPVRAFIATPVGSDEELNAAQALAPQIGQCVAEGQTIAVEAAAIRDVLAVALYRHVAAPPAPAAAAASPPAR